MYEILENMYTCILAIFKDMALNLGITFTIFKVPYFPALSTNFHYLRHGLYQNLKLQCTVIIRVW